MTVIRFPKERCLHLFGDIGSDAPILGSWYHVHIEKLYHRVDDGIWPEEGGGEIQQIQSRTIFHRALWIQFYDTYRC